MTQINVVYHFRLKASSTPAQFLTANQPIAELIQSQPGFHYRSVAQCADGSWLDSVFWESRECAQNAMTAFDKSPHAPAFIAAIDEFSRLLKNPLHAQRDLKRADVVACLAGQGGSLS